MRDRPLAEAPKVVKPKPQPPKESWWIKGMSYQEFTEQAKAQEARMAGSPNKVQTISEV